MKIRLLLAICDKSYGEHLSNFLMDRYMDIFEVNSCSSCEKMKELTKNQKFDVVLSESIWVASATQYTTQLVIPIWSEWDPIDFVETGEKPIQKYQQISSIVSEILDRYADIADKNGAHETQAKITAVWSPEGGVGKTTTAMAYAAQRVASGKKTVYLDLEPFSSVSTYFTQNGKSISTIFGRLTGNAELLLQSIRQEDNESGIFYFCQPDNYDDMNALTVDEISTLIKSCAQGIDELVIDLGNGCDEKIQVILDIANEIFLVLDTSQVGRNKWEQFRTQHNLYKSICEKIVLVLNRGARNSVQEENKVIALPLVQSNDPIVVYKTLSVGYFLS